MAIREIQTLLIIILTGLILLIINQIRQAGGDVQDWINNILGNDPTNEGNVLTISGDTLEQKEYVVKFSKDVDIKPQGSTEDSDGFTDTEIFGTVGAFKDIWKIKGASYQDVESIEVPSNVTVFWNGEEVLSGG